MLVVTQQQESLSLALIGNPPRPPNPTSLLFVMIPTTATAEFNATVDTTTLNDQQKAAVKSQFSVCLNNAEAAGEFYNYYNTTAITSSNIFITGEFLNYNCTI